MIFYSIILLSIISGIGYRMGGWGGSGREEHPTWPGWLFDTKARDLGCAFCTVGAGALLGIPFVWWTYLLAFLLTFGSLTTYWDKLFGYDNYWFHGFCIGMALMPFAFANGLWIPLLLRSVVLAILMGLWSLYNVEILCWGEDETEEFGRGFLIIITMLFYLV